MESPRSEAGMESPRSAGGVAAVLHPILICGGKFALRMHGALVLY